MIPSCQHPFFKFRYVKSTGLFFILFLGLLLTSCGKKFLFDDVRTLPSEGWQKDQKERFVFTVLDTTNTFLFYLHVRNEIDYRYSNLYVFMETQFPNGNITRDTLECILAEPSGKWTGKGYGRLKENMILLNPTIKFPVKGAYTIDIEQAMRDENLEGITNIGIRIERNPR